MISNFNFRLRIFLVLMFCSYASVVYSSKETAEKWTPVRGLPGDLWADVIIGGCPRRGKSIQGF